MSRRAERYLLYVFLLIAPFVAIRTMERSAWIADEILRAKTSEAKDRMVMAHAKRMAKDEERVQVLAYVFREFTRKIFDMKEAKG